MKTFIAMDDAMGRPSAILPAPTTTFTIVLSPGQAKTAPVPTGARVVLFSASAPFWARIGEAAAVPTADVLDGSGPEANPIARALEGATLIGLAAASACAVSLSFYR